MLKILHCSNAFQAEADQNRLLMLLVDKLVKQSASVHAANSKTAESQGSRLQFMTMCYLIHPKDYLEIILFITGYNTIIYK